MYFYWTTVEIYLAMNSILAKRLSIVILVKKNLDEICEGTSKCCLSNIKK
jgi:uncharacterized cysteine cluster protein YcgN (CxxCxxCC family)